MSSQDQITPAELRELADLDALGLLDEIDSRRFEQALQAATVTDQESIRTRQATLLQRLVGAPVDELPEGLRERVLGAIRTEIEQMDEALAPIATIGRKRRERSTRTADAMEPLAPAPTINPLEMVRVRRAAFAWRAASFGLMAGLMAALVFAYSMSQVVKTTEAVASQKFNNAALRDALSDNLNELTNPSESDKIISPATVSNQRGSITALLQTHQDKNVVKLAIIGLAKGEYTIKIKEGNSWLPAHTFTVHEENTLVTLEDLPSGAAQRLAVSDWRVVDSNDILVAQTHFSLVG